MEDYGKTRQDDGYLYDSDYAIIVNGLKLQLGEGWTAEGHAKSVIVVEFAGTTGDGAGDLKNVHQMIILPIEGAIVLAENIAKALADWSRS